MKTILLSILFFILGISIVMGVGYLLLIIPEIGAIVGIIFMGGLFFGLIALVIELFIGKG